MRYHVHQVRTDHHNEATRHFIETIEAAGPEEAAKLATEKYPNVELEFKAAEHIELTPAAEPAPAAA